MGKFATKWGNSDYLYDLLSILQVVLIQVPGACNLLLQIVFEWGIWERFYSAYKRNISYNVLDLCRTLAL